jgi:hypothetical protein
MNKRRFSVKNKVDETVKQNLIMIATVLGTN